MKDLKRYYWNPVKTAKGMTLCTDCPFQCGIQCGLGHEVRNTRIAGHWVPASRECTLTNVTWSIIEERKPDVEQETG